MKQLKYVLVLANAGSFSVAADELGITQPSLSQYVKKIEKQIGMDLFSRVGGNVRLTYAGEIYIDIGRKMLDLEHQLEEKFRDVSSNKSGIITIGISAHRSVSLMPNIVSEFHKKYPCVVLKIKEMRRDEILDAAEHGEFDLCLTTLPVDNKRFDYDTVLVEENVLAVPDSVVFQSEMMPGRKFPAISVKTIDGMNFAMLNEGHLMQRELDDLCSRYGLSLNKMVICTSLEALLEMVKIGIGAAFIPSCIARPCSHVRYYSIKEATAKREIILMHRKNQYLSRVVEDLAIVIRKTLLDS